MQYSNPMNCLKSKPGADEMTNYHIDYLTKKEKEPISVKALE